MSPLPPAAELDPGTQAIYRRLATWMARRRAAAVCPVFGINGAQGSGKSTAAAVLRDELSSMHGLRAVVLSLDDFYLPRAVRLQLAREVHPLFATRGVPGTHDVRLGITVLQALRRLGSAESIALPRFSKADDDRCAEGLWTRVQGPVDLVLFEGWCVGTPPQADAELDAPVNALEAQEDADGRWRRSVNTQLGGAYAEWFGMIDRRVFLRVPDFDCVRRWRWQQEQDTARAAGGAGQGLQTPAQLERFVQHYERLSAHALHVLPAQAEVLLSLHEDHRLESASYAGPRG